MVSCLAYRPHRVCLFVCLSGTTVADILTHCLDLVSASNIGATEGHGQEDTLSIRTYHDKGRYLNVNTASIPGINHAKQMGLAQSGLAEVVVLHRLHEGAILFDHAHRARVFCMFRHPVERAISVSIVFRSHKVLRVSSFCWPLSHLSILDVLLSATGKMGTNI